MRRLTPRPPRRRTHDRGPAATVLLALTIALPTAPASATSTHPASSTQASEACAEVAILTMVGSGQDGQTIASPLNHTLAAIQERLNNAHVTTTATPVSYPAEPVVALLQGRAGQDRFFDSMETGTANLVSDLQTRATTCPSQQYVLLGYSQGAMSIQAATSQLPTLATRISAIGLVASGDRTPDWQATETGTSKRGTGITKGFLGVTRAPLPRNLANRTISLCNRKDLVCDFGLWNSFGEGLIIHNSYSQPRATTLGRALAEKVLQTAIPTVSTVDVIAEPGEQVGAWVTARSFTRSNPTWRLAVNHSLPRGMTFTSRGHLYGSAAAGSSTVKVEVAGRADGVWLPVVLNITIGQEPPPTPSVPHTVIDLTGAVRMSSLDGSEDPAFPVGTPVTASYSFPTTSEDLEPDSTIGMYESSSAGTRFSVTVDGVTFSTDPNDPSVRLTVSNTDRGDSYRVSTTSSNQTPINGFPPYGMTWGLHDVTGQALDSDALPAGPPDLTSFSQRPFGLQINEIDGESFFIQIDITTATRRG